MTRILAPLLRPAFVGLLLAVLILVPAGCGRKSAPTQPAGPPPGTIADLYRLLASATLSGLVPPAGIDSTVALISTMSVNGTQAASAIFVRGALLADANGVWVRAIGSGAPPDSVRLTARSLVIGSIGLIETVYSTLFNAPPTLGLPFHPWILHHFWVTGSLGYPGFDVNMAAVDGFSLSSPTAGATVPRSADLAVVPVRIETDSLAFFRAMVVSLVDSSKVALSSAEVDTVSQVGIPASELMTLPAGPARLSAARYRFTYFVRNALPVGFLIENAQTRNITLQ